MKRRGENASSVYDVLARPAEEADFADRVRGVTERRCRSAGAVGFVGAGMEVRRKRRHR